MKKALLIYNIIIWGAILPASYYYYTKSKQQVKKRTERLDLIEGKTKETNQIEKIGTNFLAKENSISYILDTQPKDSIWSERYFPVTWADTTGIVLTVSITTNGLNRFVLVETPSATNEVLVGEIK